MRTVFDHEARARQREQARHRRMLGFIELSYQIGQCETLADIDRVISEHTAPDALARCARR